MYDAAIAGLTAAGLTYECFCTRREIREAIAAPHGPQGAYPGTCRDLTPAERDERRRARPPAVRLRAAGEVITIDDALAGSFTGAVDDVVLRRNDGVPAYNLAVVVDDAAQGVTDVVRGDDLLPSTPRQVLLQRLLGLPPVRYVHVPLVVGADGQRLAKRHGAVTLEDLGGDGVPAVRVVGALAASLGLAGHGAEITAGDLLDRLRPRRCRRRRSGAGAPRRPATILVVNVDDRRPRPRARLPRCRRRAPGRGGARPGPARRAVLDAAVLPGRRPGGRARRVRRRPRRSGAGPTRCRWRRSARALYQVVQDDLGARIWPQLQQVWPLIDYHGLRDAFVIRYAMGEQESLREHHDVAQVSASVKLDDDHEGAELRFPRQGVDNADVPVGALLAWPSLVTHPHEVAPLRRGVKHGLTIWFELPFAGLEL